MSVFTIRLFIFSVMMVVLPHAVSRGMFGAKNKGIEMKVVFQESYIPPTNGNRVLLGSESQVMVGKWGVGSHVNYYAHNLYTFLVENQLAFKVYNPALGFGFLFNAVNKNL